MKPHPPIPEGARLLKPCEVHPGNDLSQVGIRCSMAICGAWGTSWMCRGNSCDEHYIVPADTPRIIPPLNASTVEAWRAAYKANSTPVASRSRDSLTKSATLRRRASSVAYGRAKGVWKSVNKSAAITYRNP